jgi:rhodanese-related sulfurtransferase
MRNIFLILITAIFAFADFKGINPSQLQEMINKNITVIDIRTPPEWKEVGTIPTSKKIMFFDEKGQYDVQNWLYEFSKDVKDKEQAFVLVCRSGNRTETVGNFLSKQLGFKNVYHLQDGIKSWIKEGKEVDK